MVPFMTPILYLQPQQTQDDISTDAANVRRLWLPKLIPAPGVTATLKSPGNKRHTTLLQLLPCC